MVFHQVRPDDPKLVGRPMLEKENWKFRVVSLMLHGDGVSFTTGGAKLTRDFFLFPALAEWLVRNVYFPDHICL